MAVNPPLSDDSYADFVLPFDFPVRGVVFPAGTTLHLVSNGWLNFGSPGTSISWNTIYEHAIGFWWDDHDPNAATAGNTHDAFTNHYGVNCYYFQYEDWEDFPASDLFDIRTELCEDGLVYTYVSNGPGLGSTSSVGSVGSPTSENARLTFSEPWDSLAFVMVPQYQVGGP